MKRLQTSLFDPAQDSLFADPVPAPTAPTVEIGSKPLVLVADPRHAFRPAAPTIKALSLWQPWATLVIYGFKKYETRGWPCPPGLIGKELAIHATGTLRKEAREIVEDEAIYGETWFADAFADLETTLDELPRGAVLGIVRVVECLRTERFNPTLQEAAFGNYEAGRYAWRMEIVERFQTPVPARGMQGIWDWSGGGS